MTVMTREKLDKLTQITIRSNETLKGVYERLVTDLRGVRWLRFKGKQITREGFGNAVWLYLAAMPTEQLAATLAPHVARLEAMLPDEAGRAGPDVLKEGPSSGMWRDGEYLGPAAIPAPADQSPPRSTPAAKGRKSRRSGD